MDNYLLSLFAEYTTLVDTMHGGRYTPEEAHQLDSERQVLHNQLIAYLGKEDEDRRFDMYTHARNELYNAKKRGWK